MISKFRCDCGSIYSVNVGTSDGNKEVCPLAERSYEGWPTLSLYLLLRLFHYFNAGVKYIAR